MTLRTKPTVITYPVTLLALLISSTSLLVSAAGEDHPKQSFIQHQSHQHGLVEFNIAQQGKQLLIEVQAPGSDLLGFEHAPETDQQQRQLQAAQDQLQQPQQLFSLASAAQCKLLSVDVQHNLAPPVDGEHATKDEAKEHEEHAGKDDAKEHEEHEEHEEQGEHSGFSAQYQFRCDNIKGLKQISSRWFEHFPASEKIDVQLITDAGQKSLSLTANQAVIGF